MNNNPGLTLKRLREDKHLTMRDLMALCGVDSSTISRMENGHLENTELRHVRSVCQALEIDIETLFTKSIHTCPTCNGKGWIIGEGGGDG